MPAMGHLVHMPSHIDAWVGGYKEGVKCNEDGVAADDAYVTESGNESQFYKFYRMHNMHFVVWMSMHDGRYGTATSTSALDRFSHDSPTILPRFSARRHPTRAM